MNSPLKQFLNSLYCPICGGQIDCILNNRQFNYGCASNIEHYRLWIDRTDVFPPIVEYEVVVFYENCLRYLIRQHYKIATVDFTEINISKTNAENVVIDHIPIKSLTYDKCLFDFSISNKEKMLNRIKTILVFQ